MEWSPAKEQVFAFESDIVVSAGAGSGKTAALVELYLRLLAGETRFPSLSVEEIVAITFTDKAALEMLERVRAGMAQRLARGDNPRFWAEGIRALSAAPIATFHSFCARLLRENPAEAGVDPAFTLLDELAAWGEIRGAVDEVIEGELKARSPGIRLLLDQYPLAGAGRGKGLREHLLDLHRKLSASGRNAAELHRAAADWDAAARVTLHALPGRIDAVAARIRSAVRERTLRGGKEPAFLQKMRDLLELCGGTLPVPDDDAMPAVLEQMLACLKGAWGKDDASLREETREILDEAKRSFYQLKSSPVVATLLELSGKLEEAYRSRKARRGALDFDDLQLRTRDLLQRDATVRDDCRKRFPVIMVDEFQDTNPLQKELLALLCGEGQRLFIVGDPKQSIYLFRGADVSVFGRTQAEISARGGQKLFFQESFRSREGIIAFVNHLFSAVMGRSEEEADPSGPGFDILYREGDHLQPQRLDWDGSPCVELLAVASGDESKEKRRAEARAVARRILGIVSGEEGIAVYDRTAGTRTLTGLKDSDPNGPQGPGTGEDKTETRNQQLEPLTPDLDQLETCDRLSPNAEHLLSESRVPSPLGPQGSESPVFVPRRPRFGDIAILFRRFTHLKLFEQELRRGAIPYYVVRGKGFYRCQEVLDLLNFLRYLDFSGDLPSLAGVLRSPLCGVSDETLYLLSRLEGGIGQWEKFFSPSPITLHPSPIPDRIDPLDRERLRALALLLGRLRPLRDRLTLAELMEEILVGTDFVSSLYATYQGEQKAANLRKLIELSRSFTGQGEGGLRRFVAYLDDLVAIEPTEAEAVISAEGENVVRLMTVHQSKGLEFPVVFIPEMGAGSPADGTPVTYDHDLGVGARFAGPGGTWEHTVASRAITELRNRKEAAERKRLFYVATTRARDYLVLSGERGRSAAGSWREWVDGLIAGESHRLLKVSRADVPPGEAAEAAVVPGESGVTAEAEALGIVEGIRRSLHYTPPLPSSMTFSPTALEDYATCPRKYYYKAVMGLDEGLFAELLAPSPSRRKPAGRGMTPLEKGDLAHLLLERVDFLAEPPALRAACMQIAVAVAADPQDAGVREVVDAVVAFISSGRGRELAGARLLREWPFTLRLEGEGVYFIRGAMDLVAPEVDRVTVYDYKYLSRENADLEGYRFQLRTYMLALARRWPERRTGGKLVFLKGGGEEGVDCDFQAFEADLVRIMDAIRRRSAEEDFGVRERCDGEHCPFRQRCRTKAAGEGKEKG